METLPEPGVLVPVSEDFVPTLMRGMTVHPEQPFHFDFIFDSGNGDLTSGQLETEATRMIKYFMAALTVPREDLWVNLSPGEQDRIIPKELARTQLGRDLLAQDYLLKQLSSTLLHPDQDVGKDFWSRVYGKVRRNYGGAEVPMDTFNKVWIVPESAAVFEQGAMVYVRDAHLKVMLERDYLATKDIASAKMTEDEEISQTIAREVIVPEIEYEINHGRNFAPLRQIYYALILAKWYKQTMPDGALANTYVDKEKVDGVDDVDAGVASQIYDRYMAAYRRGVFDMIKEDYDQLSGKVIPRRYFSGGFEDADITWTRTDQAALGIVPTGKNYLVTVDLNPRRPVRDQSILGEDGRFMTGGFRGWNRRIVLPVSLVLAGLIVIGTCRTCVDGAAAQDPEIEMVQQMFDENRLEDIIMRLRRTSFADEEAYLDQVQALGTPLMERLILAIDDPDSFLYQQRFTPRLSREAHRILARFGEPAVDRLIALLDEPYPEIHGNVADALRDLGARRAVTDLIPKLVNADGQINARVSRAIAELGGPEARPALPVYISILQAENKDAIAHGAVFGLPRNHGVAIAALRQIGDESVIPVLENYLRELPMSTQDQASWGPVVEQVTMTLADIYLRSLAQSTDLLPTVDGFRQSPETRLRRLAYEIESRLPDDVLTQLGSAVSEEERLAKIRTDLQEGDADTRVYAILDVAQLPTRGSELIPDLLDVARTEQLRTTSQNVYWPFHTRRTITRDVNAGARMEAIRALLRLDAPAEELFPILKAIITDMRLNTFTEQRGGTLFGVAVEGIRQLGPAARAAGPDLLTIIDVPAEEIVFSRSRYYPDIVNALVDIGYEEGVIPVVERHFLGQNLQTPQYRASLRALARDPAALLRIRDRAWEEKDFIWWQRKASDIDGILKTHPQRETVAALLMDVLNRDFSRDDFLERRADHLALLAEVDPAAFTEMEERIFQEKRWPVIRNWGLAAGGGLLALLGLYGYLRRLVKEDERSDSALLAEDLGGIDLIDIPVERSGQRMEAAGSVADSAAGSWITGFSPVIRTIAPLSFLSSDDTPEHP